MVAPRRWHVNRLVAGLEPVGIGVVLPAGIRVEGAGLLLPGPRLAGGY